MGCKDRLPELQKRMSGYQCDVTVEPAPPSEPPPELRPILEQLERVFEWIRVIESNTQRILRLHDDHALSGNEQLQSQLDRLVTESDACAAKVLGAARELSATGGSAGGAAGGGAKPLSVAGRVARGGAAAARGAAHRALRGHAAALTALRDTRHKILTKHIQLTNREVSEEECEALLDQEYTQLFVDNLRLETAAARLALAAAEARRGELLAAEGSLRELHQLFTQLALLVHQQQDQIDTVEYFALQAGEHVEEGGRELLKGSVSRRKSTQKKISLIICLASGFLIVVLVLVLT